MTFDNVDRAAVEGLVRGISAKEAVVERHGAGADINITLELLTDGTSLGLALLSGDADRVVPHVTMIIGMSDADQAVFMAEAYCWKSDEPPPHPPVAGDLARWHAEGNPHTHECIQVVSVRRDGRVDLLQTTYAYAADGAVVWGDTWILPESAGPMADMLIRGFEIQAARPSPSSTVDEICKSLHIAFLVPMLAPPPRNRPCPCGSGDKAKHCCWAQSS